MNMFVVVSTMCIVLMILQVVPASEPVQHGKLERNLFLELEDVGEVTDMAFGQLDGEDKNHLIVVGTRGFALLGLDGTIVRTRAFEPTRPPEYHQTAQRRIIDIDGDGHLDLMALARSWVGRTSRYHADGSVMWVHPQEPDPRKAPAVTFTSCGDVDGDGSLEILMKFNATNLVQLLNAEGDLVWSQNWSQAPVGHWLEFLDVDGNGKRDLVYIDGKAVCVRNGDGELILRTVFPEGGVNRLELVEGFGTPPRDWLLVGYHVKHGANKRQSYRLVGLDATTFGPTVPWGVIEKYRRIQKVEFHNTPMLRGVLIDEIEKQAPVAGIAESSLLVRFLDKNRNVIYTDNIAPSHGKVAVGRASLFLKASGSNKSRLLISYGSRVWEYFP